MKNLAITFLVMLFLVTATMHAQTAVIKFPRGSAPATIKGHVNPLSSESYQLSVSAGQRVAIHLTSTSRKRLVVFDVRTDKYMENTALPGANNVTDWEGELKKGGDYWIPVFALREAGEENFTLVISTPPENPGGGSTISEADGFPREKVPSNGATVKEFVPAGWKIAARAQGDLNGDGQPDQVVEIVDEDTPDDRTATDSAPEAHALLVLLADGGSFRRAALATKFLASSVPQYNIELVVKNGIITVNQDYGMSDVTSLKHLFRYEPQTQRFLLIGKDTFFYTRPLSDDTVKTSENFLTGVRLTTTGHFRRNSGVGPETTKREQIERKKIYLEELNEDPASN